MLGADLSLPLIPSEGSRLKLRTRTLQLQKQLQAVAALSASHCIHRMTKEFTLCNWSIDTWVYYITLFLKDFITKIVTYK